MICLSSVYLDIYDTPNALMPLKMFTTYFNFYYLSKERGGMKTKEMGPAISIVNSFFLSHTSKPDNGLSSDA